MNVIWVLLFLFPPGSPVGEGFQPVGMFSTLPNCEESVSGASAMYSWTLGQNNGSDHVSWICMPAKDKDDE